MKHFGYNTFWKRHIIKEKYFLVNPFSCLNSPRERFNACYTFIYSRRMVTINLLLKKKFTDISLYRRGEGVSAWNFNLSMKFIFLFFIFFTFHYNPCEVDSNDATKIWNFLARCILHFKRYIIRRHLDECIIINEAFHRHSTSWFTRITANLTNGWSETESQLAVWTGELNENEPLRATSSGTKLRFAVPRYHVLCQCRFQRKM